MDHAAGLPHKSATNILRPVKLPVWNRFTSQSSQQPQASESQNGEELESKPQSTSAGAELRSFNLEYPRMSPPKQV